MAMRWIDMKEMKPKNNTNVLVYCPDEDSVTIAKYYDDIDCFMDENDAEFEGSHWMPLPPKPKKEAQ